ncbi:MAG: hypothetical protein AB7O65_10850 [Candidatus Korobacteraceae bacterium]
MISKPGDWQAANIDCGVDAHNPKFSHVSLKYRFHDRGDFRKALLASINNLDFVIVLASLVFQMKDRIQAEFVSEVS